MKRHLHVLATVLLGILMLNSCSKDENKIYYTGGTAPVLSASRTTTIPLSFADSTNEAVKLTWTNPNYQFTTGLSSQDVNYLLEIDTTGANFTNPGRQRLTISKDLSIAFTVAQLNDYLLNQLQLRTGVSHNVEMRVTSTLTGGTVPLVSNVLKFSITPYAIPPKVNPPVSGNLYITGAATSGGWMTDNPPSPVIPAQTFTKRSTTLFEIASINLIGGQEYLLVPVFGNWSAKYGATVATPAFDPVGGDFRENGNNFKAPAVSGAYSIQVDFQRGKITVTKL
jgi:starch-binding outer membrane protein SusE/F